MITLTIEAKDAVDLRAQLSLLLGQQATVALANALTEDIAAEAASMFQKKRAEEPSVNQTPAKRGRPKKSREPLEPLEPSQSGMAPEGSLENDANAPGANSDTPDDHVPVNETNDEIASEIDAQAAKDEVLPKLRDLFVSGQVKQLRAILDKFGEGAGSIPEIDAKHFPAIREFLAQGALQ